MNLRRWRMQLRRTAEELSAIQRDQILWDVHLVEQSQLETPALARMTSYSPTSTTRMAREILPFRLRFPFQ